MKAYWIYRCDEGHTWMLFRDENAVENPPDSVCPFGHEAVTLHKERMLDAVQVSLRPAARIVDRVKQQVGHEHEFYLVVTNLHTGEERMSRRPSTWKDIKNLADRFRNLPASKAWPLLDRIDREHANAQPNDAAEPAGSS